MTVQGMQICPPSSNGKNCVEPIQLRIFVRIFAPLWNKLLGQAINISAQCNAFFGSMIDIFSQMRIRSRNEVRKVS